METTQPNQEAYQAAQAAEAMESARTAEQIHRIAGDIGDIGLEGTVGVQANLLAAKEVVGVRNTPNGGPQAEDTSKLFKQEKAPMLSFGKDVSTKIEASPSFKRTINGKTVEFGAGVSGKQIVNGEERELSPQEIRDQAADILWKGSRAKKGLRTNEGDQKAAEAQRQYNATRDKSSERKVLESISKVGGFMRLGPIGHKISSDAIKRRNKNQPK